jgi:outer membrane receptor protein involved in Fe transport
VLLPAVAGALLATLPDPARAADAVETGPSQLQEVVVTANRREESSSKVPISVSAYTQATMDSLGIKDFTDIARFTPGVQIDAGQTNAISIRGISSSGGAGTTGIYIDDTPIQIRALGFNPDDTLPKTFDLERVEVLRGPQGTLFGAGSEGGTVRYIMTQPSLTKASGYSRTEVSSTAGGEPSYEAGVAYGAPLIDGTLGFRVSAWFRKDGGWIDRVSDTDATQVVDPDANHDETLMLRAAAIWAPSSSVAVTPSIIFQNRQRHDTSYFWANYSSPSANSFVTANPTAQPEPDKYLLPSLKITADLGPAQLISNSSYYQRRDLSGYDGTLYNLSYYQTLGWAGGETTVPGSNQTYLPAAGAGFFSMTTLPCSPQGFTCYPLLDGSGVHLPAALANYASPASVTNNQDNYTQEIRLQSSDPSAQIVWTAGVFYSQNRTFSLEQIHDPMADQLFQYLYGETIAQAFGTQSNPDGSSYLPSGDAYLNRLISIDRQLAGFGEVVWGLTDKLKLTTGLRYSKTDDSFTSDNNGPQNGGNVPNGGQQHERPITERASLSYQIDPRDLVYATYSTGFRIGGANSIIPPGLCSVDFARFGISDNPASYKSDTVKNYELGAKSRIAGRLSVAASAYYIKWDNIQQQILLPTCALQYIANVGTATSKGFDLQADLAVSQGLTLQSAVGYNDTHYATSSYAGPASPAPIAAAGDAVTGESGLPTPPWTVTLGAEYRLHWLKSGDSYLRLDYELQTQNHRPSAAEDPVTVQFAECSTPTGDTRPCSYTPPSTTFVSARAGQEIGGWNISLFADNLLNTHVVTNSNYQGVDGFGPQIATPYTAVYGTTAPVATPLYRYLTFRPRTIGITATYRY